MAGGGGLEFLMELDAKLDGIAEGLKVLDRLDATLKHLDGTLTKFDQHLEKSGEASRHAARKHEEHEHSLWKLGHQFEYVKNGLHEFAEALGLVLGFEMLEKGYEVVEHLVDKVIELGKETLVTAAKAERFSKAFEISLGAGEGSEMLEYIEGIAKYTEFSRENLKGFSLELLRGGFAAEEIPRAMAASLDLAARAGDKMDGMQRAISALSMIKATGRVEGRLFKRLGIGEENAPEKFFKDLSARTGKGVTELKKEIEKGKAPIGAMLESIYTLIAGKRAHLGDAGIEQSAGMAAKITHLREVPELLMEKIEKSPAFGKMTAFIEKIGDLFGPEGPLGEKLARSLDVAFTKFVDVVSKVDLEKMFTGIAAAIERLPDLIELTTKAITKLVPLALDAAKALIEIVTFDQKHSPANRANPFSGLGYSPGKEVGAGLAGGLRDGTKGAVKATVDMTGAVKDTAATELKIRSPSKVFQEFGRMTGEGYVRGLEDSASRVDAAVASTLAASDSVKPGTFARPASGAAFGPIQVTVNVTTNVNGAGEGEGAAKQFTDELAARVESITIATIQSALEQAQIEAGA